MIGCSAGNNFPKNTWTGIKRNGATAADSLSDKPQAMNSSYMVKHGGASIIIWGCFSYYGVGPIYGNQGIMDQFEYIKILEEVTLPYAEEEIPLKWVFQQDNEPQTHQ